MQLAHDISSFGDVLNMSSPTILRIFVFRIYIYVIFIIPGQIIDNHHSVFITISVEVYEERTCVRAYKEIIQIGIIYSLIYRVIHQECLVLTPFYVFP